MTDPIPHTCTPTLTELREELRMASVEIETLRAELHRQSQELGTLKDVALEAVLASARYCGQRKYRKIHLRQVFAAVDTLAALTQPAPEKPI